MLTIAAGTGCLGKLSHMELSGCMVRLARMLSLHEFVLLHLSQMFWQHAEVYSIEVTLGVIFP